MEKHMRELGTTVTRAAPLIHNTLCAFQFRAIQTACCNVCVLAPLRKRAAYSATYVVCFKLNKIGLQNDRDRHNTLLFFDNDQSYARQ